MITIAQKRNVTQARNAYNEYIWLRKLMKNTFVNDFTDIELINEKLGYTTTSVIEWIINELELNKEDDYIFNHIMDCIDDEDHWDFAYGSLLNYLGEN